MNYLETFKYAYKEKFYDLYTRFFDDVDYDKITRKKMIERIVELYSDPENIVALCSKAEVNYLKLMMDDKARENNPLKYFLKIEDSKNWLLREKLISKKIISFFNKTDVPDELILPIKKAINLYKKKELIELDQDINLLLGAMRVFVYISRNDFINCMKSFFDDDEEKLLWLMNTSRFKFYVKEELDDKNIEHLLFVELDYLVDEVIESLEIYGVNTYTTLTREAYIDIFDYGFDLSKSFNSTYFKKKPLIDSVRIDVEKIVDIGILNGERTAFLELRPLINIGDTNHKEDELVNEMLDNYPSAALRGKALVEYDKFEADTSDIISKIVSSSCKKQTNACVGNGEANNFMNIFLSLLCYLDVEYGIVNNPVQNGNERTYDSSEIHTMTDFFFKNPVKYVDEYLEENKSFLKGKERRIVEEFKKTKSGLFVIYNYKEQYAQLLDDDAAYQVKGFDENIDTIIPREELPVAVKTNLIMYKGNIIYDGRLGIIEKKIPREILCKIVEAYDALPKKYSLDVFAEAEPEI